MFDATPPILALVGLTLTYHRWKAQGMQVQRGERAAPTLIREAVVQYRGPVRQVGESMRGAELDIVVVMVLRVGLPPRGRQKGESDA